MDWDPGTQQPVSACAAARPTRDVRRCAGFEEEFGTVRLPDAEIRLLGRALHIRVEMQRAPLTPHLPET